MRVVRSDDGGPSGEGVSSVEVFGFVGWITSSVAYVLYMLWSYVPNSVLEAYGIHYYPSKYWAVALPTWVCVTVVAVYWAYEGLCMMSALPPGDPSNLRDWATRRKEDAGMPSYFSPAVHAVPPLVDIPQQIVSDVLFGGLMPQEAEQRYNSTRQRRQGAPPDSDVT
ncbi:phosphatidylinositol N-acetylglucosaminyltransferase subunit P-like [Chlorella sorokiniana]|uniref:Phosphatidylinositol N-acetylglucosaminyltransferase subunit P-like n=1 Tax=Chlorella sorokiniana TaxID=3076 RepID=A0A2P6U0J6_CHLSO|nr:phosphatidylinositol N-acetylglucosaminyltransferase subunit P-like [Chlorella sorokiniana]|eukprot:PRW59837.1 phosphatidylinositol N-acetylglucosaminyltransferase subunit P-like [Chlorella sorokiniana]